jgi:energy-coupling factor transporter ATP-binding protein EcfA2
MLRRIELCDIGPFVHWEADRITTRALITGDNGDGKSTLANVFSCMLDDHNTHLIRNGADSGEIYMELEVRWNPETGEIDQNGTETGIIKSRQRVKRGGSKYEIELPNGLKVLKSQKEFLKGLITGASLDPMKIAHGSDKERLEYVLSVFSIQIERHEILPILGDDTPRIVSYGLDEFDNLIATQESRRSEQNAQVKATKGLLAKLEQSLPPAPAEAVNWQVKEKDLRKAHAEARSRLEQQRIAIDNEYRDACDYLKEQTADKLRVLDEQEQAEIEQVRLKFKELRSAEESLQRAKRDQLEAIAKTQKEEDLGPLEAEFRRVSDELSVAEERAKQHMRDEVQRQNVEDSRVTFRAETLEATRRQKIVEALRELRGSKVSCIDIEGVDIRDGAIYVDGKNYGTQLNEAERIKVAVEIAAKAVQKLPVRMMVIDAGDNLSEKNIEWIMAGAEATGIQVFLSKRSEEGGGLRVIPYEEYRSAAA